MIIFRRSYLSKHVLGKDQPGNFETYEVGYPVLSRIKDSWLFKLGFFFSLNLLGKGMKETDDQDRVKHLEKKFSMKIQQGLKMKLVPSCKIRAYY